MPQLKSELLFTVDITVGRVQNLPATPLGDRRIVEVTGGTFEGPRMNGKILPCGGDWILLRRDGVLQLDVRLTLETDDEQLIYMTYHGFRHGPAEVIARLNRGEAVAASEYYFRIAPMFQTGSEKYAWLNGIVAAGVGDRKAAGPRYQVFEIL